MISSGIINFPFRLANPLLLGLLIGFFTDNPNQFSERDAYLIATGIALTIILPTLFFHPFMLFLFEEAMKLRISCCSLIYSKVSKDSLMNGTLPVNYVII